MSTNDPSGPHARDLTDYLRETFENSIADGYGSLRTVPPVPDRHKVLALPMQGGACDGCHRVLSTEVAMLFDAQENPTLAICADCAAACIQVALGVKMSGLVLQWRTQAAIKAERIARDEAAKAQRRNRKETTNASE